MADGRGDKEGAKKKRLDGHDQVGKDSNGALVEAQGYEAPEVNVEKFVECILVVDCLTM